MSNAAENVRLDALVVELDILIRARYPPSRSTPLKRGASCGS